MGIDFLYGVYLGVDMSGPELCGRRCFVWCRFVVWA